MKVDLFDFELPERLIAQVPLEQRDASRLMVLDKHTGELTDSSFKHIISFFNEGDCLVLNNTGTACAVIRHKRGYRRESGTSFVETGNR